jgi:predicted DNA-binding transcriptional regulator AlpA
MAKTYLRIRHLRERYKLSEMSFWRRIHTGTFPPPDFYDGRERVWNEATIDAHDARAIAETATRKAKTKARADAALARRANSEN